MRIFITGCGKSGTTLLLRLFAAFSNVVLVPNEHTAKDFSFMDDKDIILVGKRSQREIYSSWSGKGYFFESLLELREHKVKLVNIFRDGRDVIESGDGQVLPRKWIDCIYQIIDYPQYLTMNLRYEDMVTKPDVVQQSVVDKLDLKIKYKWSDYPKFLDKEVEHWRQFRGIEAYNLRPISTDRIGKDHQLYKFRCSPSERLEFEKMLQFCGYVK